MIYTNNYMSEHSEYLREIFDISNRGVDWYTNSNLAIEFKESFTANIRNQIFSLKESQVKHSDLFVFSILNDVFYVIDTYDIQNQKRIRIGKIQELAIAKFTNLIELYDFLNTIQYER